MATRVAFVELPVFSGVVPLASGYMEAYCRQDPLLRDHCAFEKISLPVTTPYLEVLARIERADADVYAFSCYVWNVGLVRRLVHAIMAAQPRAHIVLGGPQVMHHADRYLEPGGEHMLVCNGEGERTFANILRALRTPTRDFAQVRGLSFYRDGRLVTTEPEPRISDLAEIPSPFLEGLFERAAYTWMLIETNRGCPFQCNYCFWGAATGAKVYRFDEDRLQRELTWISQSGCWYLFIADANWGMLKRDVDLSRYLVDCRRRAGAPLSVYFCGSKNTPDRVAEISRIFHEAGMVSCQSVALQTMNPETLRRVNRDNIKTAAYTQVQQRLNEQGIASFVELIWPLPGETLATFQDGVATLCRLGADCFLVYPLLLINNVELDARREEYGLVAVRDPDPNSEAEIVVQTAEVDAQAYRDGARYVYAATALYTIRGLRCLAHYLDSRGVVAYDELFRRFADFWRRRPGHSWSAFCEASIAALDNVTFSNTGALLHLALHAQREAFDELLEEFVTSQHFWHDAAARVAFELDLINRPYIYRNTPIAAKRHAFTELRVDVLADGYLVEVPAAAGELMAECLNVPARATRFAVNHRRSKLPFMPGKSLHEHYMYCQDMSQRMRELLPVWRPVEQPAIDSVELTTLSHR